MNKEGQFYLVTAIVIVVIIISFAAIQNYTKRESAIKIYDIKDELGIESGNVLDYGTFEIDDEEKQRELIENFSEEYAEYAGEGRDLYFVFGNSEKINLLIPEEIESEVNIIIGQSRAGTDVSYKELISREYTPEEGEVEVELPDGTRHNFKLGTQENFYFIISEEIGGEKHVVTS